MRYLPLLLAFVLAAAPAAAAAQPAEGFADLAEELSPAVVNISAARSVGAGDGLPTFPPGSPLERFNDFFGEEARIANSLGSGFIVDPAGVVVTNNHVIENSDQIEVILADGRVFPAELVGRDPATDLAVLRLDAPEPLPAVRFGDSDAARVGEWVFAIGNPFGLGGSLTAGVISARNRDIGGRYDDYIQSDVTINQGNSGGPLFNLAGEVIGVNTAIFSPTGASVGISFSIPSDIAETIVDQLIEYGEARRGWLGVNVRPINSGIAEAMGLARPRGALVTRVDPDGPAAQGGLEQGDLILAFDGRPVPNDRALIRMVAEAEIGAEAAVELLRDGEPMTLTVSIARLEEDGPPAPAPRDAQTGGEEAAPTTASLFGLTLAPLNDALRREFRVHPDADGLLVTAVDRDSDAAGKVRVGDVVEEIAWKRVETLARAREVASEASGDAGAAVLFTLNRDGQYVLESLRP